MTEQRRERQTGIGQRAGETAEGHGRTPQGKDSVAQPRRVRINGIVSLHDTTDRNIGGADASHSVAPAVKPAARRRTSQEAVVVVATPAKRDRVVTETVYTAPKADSRSVDKTPRRQRREAAAAAYAANEEVAAEEDRVVVAEVDRDNHGNGRHVNWTAVAGFTIAGALLFGATRLNGGAPIASATGSEEPSGSPTGAPTKLITPEPSAAAGTPNPDKTTGSLDLSLLLQQMGKTQGDSYSLTIGNWHLVYDNGNPGAVMVKDNSGINHLVSTLNTPELSTVGQAYWDGIVPGPANNQAISLVFAPGVTVLVRETTEWPVLAGQTADQATQLAFDGQVKLEAGTQPKVCTMQVDESAQATADVVLGEAPQWEALKIPDAATAAKSFGRDAYSSNPDNWESVDNGFGWKLKANKDGSNSIVEMTDLDGRGAVGLTYWDVKNNASNGHDVVAGVLAPHTMALVREVTVYAGVPKGMEKAVTDYAFKQALHLEFNTQLGVWVVKVTKTVCPAGPMPIVEQNAAVARATAEIANTTLYQQFVDKLPAGTTSLLSDGGLKIKESTPQQITVPEGYRIIYWNGKTAITKDGPITVTTAEATMYKLSN